MRILPILFIFSLMAAVTPGCSSKRKTQSGEVLRGGISTEDLRGDQESQFAGHSAEAPLKYYYSDLQIVTQTEVDGTCVGEKAIREEYVEQPKTILNEMNQLELPLGPESFRYFSVGVSFQTTGYDSIRYTFTALDGVVPSKVRWLERLIRKPGNILEFKYLDHTVSMVLQTTPVYSFTANENRDGCTIIHHVNVFGDRTSYYPRAEIQN